MDDVCISWALLVMVTCCFGGGGDGRLVGVPGISVGNECLAGTENLTNNGQTNVPAVAGTTTIARAATGSGWNSLCRG